MIEFFETYRTEIIYAVLVICSVFVLRLITNYFYKLVLKRNEFNLNDTTSVKLLKSILNVIWIVIAIMIIGSLFFVEVYEKLQNNLRFILYIGIVAILTIVSASVLNIWFRKKVELKITMAEDPTVFKFLRYITVVMVYIVGAMFILLAFPAFKGIAQTALGGAGIVALIAGVASQEALSNLVGGVFMLFVDKWFNKPVTNQEIGWKRALKIGFWQCIAMIPGVSRSMATIVGGMTTKLTRKNAAEFSFFLAVPTMAAAGGYKLLKLLLDPAGASMLQENLTTLLIGNVVAFIVSIGAIKFFIGFLTRHGFKAFGYY